MPHNFRGMYIVRFITNSGAKYVRGVPTGNFCSCIHRNDTGPGRSGWLAMAVASINVLL